MNIDRSKYVGVVGLGIMGGAISQNLVKSGFTVFGFDIALNQLKKAEAYGVKIVKSIDEISQKVD